MTKYREILRLKSLGYSERNIALCCSVSRNTVAKVCARAKELGITWPLAPDQTDKVLSKMLFPKEKTTAKRRMPDYEWVRKELLRNGVTRKLLWNEYCEETRSLGELPLMYSQFCYYLQEAEHISRATMHVPRRPGEQVEVDWAGDKAKITDSQTGKCIDACIFIGALSYSQYAYVEAFLNEKQNAWITAHVHMLEYFQGVPKIIVPDNTATAVNHKNSNWYTPVLNQVYHEMAEHYGTAIIPARVIKPKDKPNAEGTVKNISTSILAALRNETFFSLAELNIAIRKKLEEYNAADFIAKESSRQGVFLGEEKPLLAPLPATRFELAEWKVATVQFNYHIQIAKMHYSVPYNFIKKKVEVRLTDTTVEIFYNHERIASHRRLYGRPGQYATVKEHMPLTHQKYQDWNGDHFRAWARKYGNHTYLVIDTMLKASKIEQQSYRGCIGILRLAKRYSSAQLEAACEKVLAYSAVPSYKSVANVLAIMKKQPQQTIVKEEEPKNNYAITRGAKYYGGKSSC